MNFLVTDIEVVNDSATSIATIGIVGVDKGQIVEKTEYRVKPDPFEFGFKMTEINGLKAEDFVDSPSLPEIWDDLLNRFLEYDFCVAHNASFDFGILKACCNAYNLGCKNFPILDSLTYAKNSDLDVSDHKLDTLCRHLNIDITNHHNAISDAVATAQVMIYLIEKQGDNILDVFRRGGINDLSYYKLRKSIGIPNKKAYNPHWRIRSKDVEAVEINCDKLNPFCGKKVVVSGELKSIPAVKHMQF